MSSLFRALPSVDICLSALRAELGKNAPPHAFLCEHINLFLDEKRRHIKEGLINNADDLHINALLPALSERIRKVSRPALRRVLNATGVVIHTNLGRSVLAPEAVKAVSMAASGYSNLEFDLESGERGSRHGLVEGLVRTLTGAESALVVNNNAAAVLLMLDTLCQGGEVVVSRGQLVEIGGSFRIPDVMARSGAILREVGTTNRTHLRDYEAAITDQSRALLRVHTSNYRVVGFHKDVALEDMATLAHAHSLPLLEDLGSGSFVDFSPWGLPGEPTVRSVLSAGADVVTFSGDKVLGGPQAGIIAGKAKFIDAIRRNQLLRALRCDKMTLAALEATLRLYLNPEEALQRVPTLRRMTMPPAELLRLARKLAQSIRRALAREGLAARISVENGMSRVGGGSFPEHDLPTSLVRVQPEQIKEKKQEHGENTKELHAEHLRRRLLDADPPLVGRVDHDAFLLDPRTLEEQEFPLVVRLLVDSLRPLSAPFSPGHTGPGVA